MIKVIPPCKWEVSFRERGNASSVREECQVCGAVYTKGYAEEQECGLGASFMDLRHRVTQLEDTIDDARFEIESLMKEVYK